MISSYRSNPVWSGNLFFALLMLLLALGITGCGDRPEAPETKLEPAVEDQDVKTSLADPAAPAWNAEQEQALRQRVEAYWEATKSRDFASAFQLLANAQPRGSLDPATFYRKNSKAMKVTGYRIEAVHPVAPGHAQVEMRYTLGLEAVGEVFPIEKEKTDDWILIDGEWYAGKPGATGQQVDRP